MSEDLVARLQADGQLESSGRFSWDFARLGKTLEHYQLADPEHYLLRALACAVAGRATYFRLEQGALTTRLVWDCALSPDFGELSPLSGEPADRELALAVMGAERLGRVQLVSGAGELQLVLRRSGWRHLFGRSRSLILLAERGRYARLQLQPPIGAPRMADALGAFESRWGDGRAGWGAGKTLVVRDGVSFEGPSIPGLEVTWWTANLPLDLSRTRLVDGPELADWWSELTGQVMAMLTVPGCPARFRHWALRVGVGHPSFETAPIFALGNGRWATFAELRREVEVAGYLQVLSAPKPVAAVVVDDSNREFLEAQFAHHFPVDRLEASPDLPADGNYLLRWPAGPFEMGLRAQPCLEYRFWDGSAWRSYNQQPYGVDVAGKRVGWYWWPEALRVLSQKRGAADPMVQFHILSYLAYCTQRTLQGGGKRAERMRTEGRLRVWRGISDDGLQDLVEFPLRRGGSVRLSEVVEQGGDWVAFDPVGERGILVHTLVRSMLTWLLAPLTRLQDAARPRLSRAASRLVGSGPLDWEQLRSVLAYPGRVATSVHVRGVEGSFCQGEAENIQDLLEDEVHYVGDLRAWWLSSMAWCLARSGDLEMAVERAAQAVRECPDCWFSWNLQGQMRGCAGDLAGAEQSFVRSLQLQGEFPYVTTAYAELLWAAGKRWEARRRVGQDDLLAGLMNARLEDDLCVALALCWRLLEEPDCPLSVHERLGEVLSALDRPEEARHHYALFVAARPDQLVEPNISARLETAVRWLVGEGADGFR